jgi:hypothetical protein
MILYINFFELRRKIGYAQARKAVLATRTGSTGSACTQCTEYSTVICGIKAPTFFYTIATKRPVEMVWP